MARAGYARIGLVVACLAIQLMAVGCKSGSGGIANLFGSGGSDVLGTFSGSSGLSGDGGTELAALSTGDSGSSGSIGTEVATIHHPEPASLALFGTGLAGIVAYRRRKTGKST